MTLLLDSTVLIDVLRGRPAARRVLDAAAAGVPLLTTAINVEEIVRGARAAELPSVDSLFDGLVVLEVTAQDGRLAGQRRGELARRGVTLHQADCLIAACAVRAGARLATGNPKDFPELDVVVEHWPVGE